jgi:RNA polymerase sigma factor (sigma-70 family)
MEPRYDESPADQPQETPDRKNENARRELPGEVRALVGYMRDMRNARPLGREEEVALAVELHDAWMEFAALVLCLPDRWREYVVADDADGPALGRKWPLERLEASYRRLLVCRNEPGGEEIHDAVREAADLKLRIDQAREALITANLPLVVGMAKKLKNRGVAFLDLVQEGNIGLLIALDRFEHERGFRFSTFAVWWIRRGFSRAFLDKARLIRLPENTALAVGRMKRESDELTRSLGRCPTHDEIASAIDQPIEKVRNLIVASREPYRLEGSIAADDDPGLLRSVADPNAPDPLETSMERQMRVDVLEALNVLTPREKCILELRFGIGVEKRHTLKEAGAVLQLSRERVRQIERRALGKILAQRETLAEHLSRTDPDIVPLKRRTPKTVGFTRKVARPVQRAKVAASPGGSL